MGAIARFYKGRSRRRAKPAPPCHPAGVGAVYQRRADQCFEALCNAVRAGLAANFVRAS